MNVPVTLPQWRNGAKTVFVAHFVKAEWRLERSCHPSAPAQWRTDRFGWASVGCTRGPEVFAPLLCDGGMAPEVFLSPLRRGGIAQKRLGPHCATVL